MATVPVYCNFHNDEVRPVPDDGKVKIFVNQQLTNTLQPEYTVPKWCLATNLLIGVTFPEAPTLKFQYTHHHGEVDEFWFSCAPSAAHSSPNVLKIYSSGPAPWLYLAPEHLGCFSKESQVRKVNSTEMRTSYYKFTYRTITVPTRYPSQVLALAIHQSYSQYLLSS
jgi:hypothetical protein